MFVSSDFNVNKRRYDVCFVLKCFVFIFLLFLGMLINDDTKVEAGATADSCSLSGLGSATTTTCNWKNINNTYTETVITVSKSEVVLKVVETVCGGGLYHQDGSVKTFTV